MKSNMKRSRLFSNPYKIVTVAVLTSVLASCGGGGSSSPAGSSSPTTITSITPVGIVASATSQPLSILGTNFANGMTVSVTDKAGTPIYTIDTIVVSSPTVITVNVNTTTTVPTDNYVNVTVKSSGGTTLASAVLGVASTSRTLAADVQSILISKCGTCHDGLVTTAYLDMRTLPAISAANTTGLIGIPSSNCSPKFRTLPGDPRRSSSVLIDKIQVSSSGQAACSGGQMPPISSTQLSGAEIQTIIDWVAAGAN
jgi:hypothetical protein